MIQNKADYYYYLEADKISLRCGDKKHPSLFTDEIWKFERSLRKTEYLRNCKRGFIWKIIYLIHRYIYEQRSIKLGFTIPLNVFGPGLSISHRGTIVVNTNAKIGNNCRISNCVTIGEKPIIGNNVFIGPGVMIYGNLTIADDVAIGANSVVHHSCLTPNVTIGGAPAKVVNPEKGTTNRSLVVRGTEILDKRNNLSYKSNTNNAQ